MIGSEIHSFARLLWSFNRSLTGHGVRQTLDEIKKHLAELEVFSVATGTQVFDWKVPKEWEVWEAHITTPDGERICDFKQNNLHLVGYSHPFEGDLPLDELKKKLHTLPDQPEAVPYVTSYYDEGWGFCLSQNQFDALKDGTYHVVVNTRLFDGVLNYGEFILPGKSEKEIFLSTYVCHPSMANNELSGPVVLTYLARWLKSIKKLNYSYRIIFVPETIGSITYLSKNLAEMKKRIIAGFNVTCIGDNRSYSYVPSRSGDTTSDEVAKHVLKWIDPEYVAYSWLDRGSDERQYCSPGVDLPVATILRTKYGQYPEYHTSLDDLVSVVTAEGLNGGYWALRRAIEAIENNSFFVAKMLCEPQMGRRGLYPKTSKKDLKYKDSRMMMDFLSFCDGQHSLLSIAEKLNTPIWELYSLVETLESHELIARERRL